MTSKRFALGFLLCAALLSLDSTPSRAQGLFYREVEKDGRIYVFNSMDAYAQWEKGGEMGKSITRIAAGPNKETMVFDGEEAVNAYNFRHDRPGEVFARAPEKKPKLNITWKDGKTTFETDFSTLSLANRNQMRFFVTNPEKAGAATQAGFRLRRAETRIEGWALDPRVSVAVELTWMDSARLINDAYLSYDVTGDKRFQIQAGQFRVPFGRQELTSSMSQQFADRAIASDEFAKGRDLGVMAWGQLLNNKLDYRAGVFNGGGFGTSIRGNDNTKFDYVARLQWQPSGEVKFSEADFESKDKPIYALAVEYENNDQRGVTPDKEDYRKSTLGADGVFKYKGAFLFGEYFHSQRTGETSAEYTTAGFTAQAGYLFLQRRFEVAARYSQVDPSTDKDDDQRTELGGAVNYYFNKHQLKLCNDLRQLEDHSKPEGERKTLEFRSQLQFVF